MIVIKSVRITLMYMICGNRTHAGLFTDTFRVKWYKYWKMYIYCRQMADLIRLLHSKYIHFYCSFLEAHYEILPHWKPMPIWNHRRPQVTVYF